MPMAQEETPKPPRGGRLKLTLIPRSGAKLPSSYRDPLRKALYAALPEELARRLHDKILWPGQGWYSFFTYSNLYPLVYTPEGFKTKREAHLWLATPLEEAARGFRGLLEREELLLPTEEGPIRLRIAEAEWSLPPLLGETLVRTLSPVVARGRGPRKPTLYLGPEDPGFPRALEENLLRKARALGLAGRVEVVPLRLYPKMDRFKGTWVKGWWGRFVLSGSPEVIALALTAGLGEKNGAGYGFILEEAREEGWDAAGLC